MSQWGQQPTLPAPLCAPEPCWVLREMDGWVTSTLKSDTSLVQLLLSQGREGADVTGPAGIIIHVFAINQQL